NGTESAHAGAEQDRRSDAAGQRGQGRRGGPAAFRAVPAPLPGRQPAESGGAHHPAQDAGELRRARKIVLTATMGLPNSPCPLVDLVLWAWSNRDPDTGGEG